MLPSAPSSFCAPSAATGIWTTVRLPLLAIHLTILTHLPGKVLKYDGLCGFLFMGWALHYFPFYLMGRQLFLHHYLPALYFAILLLCVVFDVLTSTLRTRYRLGVAALLLLVAIANFNHLSPLAYGTPWTKKQCESARWLKTWDFSWYVDFM